MSSSVQLGILCSPCGYDDITKGARSWCSNCEEGLCEDCENAHRKNKITRNHKFISIADYRKIEHVSISQVCEHHGENLEWFCKNHEKALCMVCVTSNHKSCADVISISVASKNARQSTALSDLVESIDRTLSNIEQCITNRDCGTKEIEKQELEIKKMILEMRKKVNTHLDKLEVKLLLELGSTSRSCKSEYAKIVQKLKSAEEKLTKLREQTLHIQQFSSDIQVFLGMYQGIRSIVSETKSITDSIDSSKDYELKVDINRRITKLSKEVQAFGQIKVTENTPNLDFRDTKIEQAQISITVPTSGNRSNIQLQLIKTFRISMKEKNVEMNITGCIMLSNGHLLMANSASKSLIEYSNTGEHINDIPVSQFPCSIAVIDSCRIVVTYGSASFLEIMNNDTFQVKKKISFPKSCWGVSHQNGRLYVVSGIATIQVLDLSGRQLETLKIASNRVINLTSSKNMIFYTDCNSNKVHCCLMNGDELWQFESKNIIYPFNATVDNSDNVYVVSSTAHNLTIIQHNGKESKTLLKESDGLNRPQALYYNNEKRTLLICNKGGTAALYRLD
ncbi:Hypothetical predicted protein [Mytilus galloprovincialis]|uniref:B box-type domain-containing protein n=1 Tax=Mytilus galloprovincialis TaxID=29158 RepID=A0A8B6FTL4_MYTGA|nr:Hypothetical predicted protein [Mytilus galloprovincialis]